jgi:hypothetical protein
MHHDVRAKLDGPLQIGAQEGVVDHDGDVPFIRQLGHRGDIRHAHGGIGRRFEIKHLGV